MADDEYSVYYRRRDGYGTRLWDRFINRSEAIAQKQWCFKNPATEATMVWVLDAAGQMVGEPLLKTAP